MSLLQGCWCGARLDRFLELFIRFWSKLMLSMLLVWIPFARYRGFHVWSLYRGFPILLPSSTCENMYSLCNGNYYNNNTYSYRMFNQLATTSELPMVFLSWKYRVGSSTFGESRCVDIHSFWSPLPSSTKGELLRLCRVSRRAPYTSPSSIPDRITENTMTLLSREYNMRRKFIYGDSVCHVPSRPSGPEGPRNSSRRG